MKSLVLPATARRSWVPAVRSPVSTTSFTRSVCGSVSSRGSVWRGRRGIPFIRYLFVALQFHCVRFGPCNHPHVQLREVEAAPFEGHIEDHQVSNVLQLWFLDPDSDVEVCCTLHDGERQGKVRIAQQLDSDPARLIRITTEKGTGIPGLHQAALSRGSRYDRLMRKASAILVNDPGLLSSTSGSAIRSVQ